MYNTLINIIFIIFLGTLSACVYALETKPYVDELIDASHNKKPIPNVSLKSHLNMLEAYAIQEAYIKEQLKQDSIAGFKAGLTSHEAQSSLGIDRSIFGVLLKSGDYSSRSILQLGSFNQLTLETELGFITNQPIRKVVQSVEELKRYIDRVVPVIEMPDVGFKQAHFNAIDLVACNTGFAAYIVDPTINWKDQDINSLTVTLFRNGKIINQGQGIDALGDQWEALRWLVNQVILHGWIIEKDHLFITGALGQIIPAKPGVYRARFNDEASIEFTIQ